MWRELFGFVYGYLRRHGLSHADAEDLAQDVLEQAYRHLDAVEPGRLHAWLLVVARNRMIDRSRRGFVAEMPGEVPEVPSSELDPAEAAIVHADQDRVRQALASLGDRDARLIEWRYLEDLTVAETASREDLSVTATKVALYRARKRLRAAMDRDEVGR